GGAELLHTTLEPELPRFGGCLAPIDARKDAEPLARALLQALLSHGSDKHVSRDREEPGCGRSVGDVLGAWPRQTSLGEGLRREIQRGVPGTGAAQVKPVNRFRVTVVDL